MSGEDELTQRAIRVKQVYEPELLTKANVLGVGVGMRRAHGAAQEEVAIVVLVRRKVPAAQLAPDDRIPQQIDGVPVDVQEVGEVKAGS